MDIIDHTYKLLSKLKDLYISWIKRGSIKHETNFYAKMFEYYTAYILTQQTGQLYYVYENIPPDIKENLHLSKVDTGIDVSNCIDTIVQCKLRNKNISLSDCARSEEHTSELQSR